MQKKMHSSCKNNLISLKRFKYILLIDQVNSLIMNEYILKGPIDLLTVECR